jgi:hypothetical protein
MVLGSCPRTYGDKQDRVGLEVEHAGSYEFGKQIVKEVEKVVERYTAAVEIYRIRAGRTV